jgi:hypothetical protein
MTNSKSLSKASRFFGSHISVYEHFYFLRGLGPTIIYSIGIVELAILLRFAIGVAPRLTYGLLLHAVSTFC